MSKQFEFEQLDLDKHTWGFTNMNTYNWALGSNVVGAGIRYVACKHWNHFTRNIIPKCAPFVLYGSGDFHHVTLPLAERMDGTYALFSFDNHPDTVTSGKGDDHRLGCYNWVWKLLKNSKKCANASVWGCGNNELTSVPGAVDMQQVKQDRLRVYAWKECYPNARRSYQHIRRSNWQSWFENHVNWLKGLGITRAYVTVDTDCLESAACNWEVGLFTPQDICWSLGMIHDAFPEVRGDMCGAYSPPVSHDLDICLRMNEDHPVISFYRDPVELNQKVFHEIWPALKGGVK